VILSNFDDLYTIIFQFSASKIVICVLFRMICLCGVFIEYDMINISTIDHLLNHFSAILKVKVDFEFIFKQFK
jgi:hypothetical protein